ncbi:copper resistance protein CopC/CopD [Iamia sp. SCSIO 61187]|uniref:copper resistance CopC/CopD family protein n=1 Tax=Iamia sp. SCSIO 61187 TaxID=2722752 RepID=UPI001C630069|nr:copper resistance protein CopC [Iamia sp. SCSIO 61187]QYG95006.1 copper resistance protein CopC/CopD [Iamia sp. SCSIO 61187]
MLPLPRRRALALLALVVGMALGVLAGSTPAGAHATLQGTSPSDDAVVDEVPAAIVLTFDEPVSASTGAVQVIAPEGGRVDGSVDRTDGGRSVSIGVDGDARGTYTVAYRVVSDDGHTISGSFVFHVGERTGAATIDQTIPTSTSAVGGVGRWLGYAGAAVAVGSALLLVLLRRGPAPAATAATTALGTLVVGGAAASALGTTAALVAQTATTTGRSLVGALSLVPDVAGDSRSVAVALLRAAVLVGATLVGVAGRARRLPGVLVATGVLVAAAGLLAPVAGHPWTADPRGLAVPADALHLLAASVWLGMLVGLAVVAPRLADPDHAVRLVSRSAVVAAAVVVVTGATSAWLLLGSVEAATDTGSGQLVLLKVLGFGVLVGLGWVNRSRLVPLLGRLADDGAPDRRSAVARGRLLQVVRAEVLVGALVLAVTAGLVNQPPGRDTLAQPYSDVRTVEDLTLLLEVTPARAGDNTMHLYLTDAAGQPAKYDALEITVSRDGIPPRRLDGVTPISPDHASVYGASLPSPGTWTVAVTTVTDTTPRQFSFEVPLR